MLSRREREVIERHFGATVEEGIRVPQWEGHVSVYKPDTGRMWVHNLQPRRQAKQELVFHAIHSVASTLTCSHTLKFWDLKRPATPRETARVQGFPEHFCLPPSRYNRLIANAVAVPCATHAISCLLTPDDQAKTLTHIDMCAGIGGFAFAAEAAGKDYGANVQCVGYSEVMVAALKCYRLNFPTVPALGDATTVTQWPTCTLLTAGFPCQPFSKCNTRERREVHTKRDFFETVLEVIVASNAQRIVLENVPTLLTAGRERFHSLRKGLQDLGFELQYVVLNATHFGLPQYRKRLYIIGRRDGGLMRNLDAYVATEQVVLSSILEAEAKA